MYILLLLCSKGGENFIIISVVKINVLLTRTKFSDNHEIAKIRYKVCVVGVALCVHLSVTLKRSHDPPRGVQRQQWWLVDSLLPETLTQRALLRAVMKKSQRPTWGPLGNPEILALHRYVLKSLCVCVMMNSCCVSSPVASASDGWTYWLAGGVDMIHTSCTTAVWTHTHIATIPFHINFPPLNSHSIIICVPFPSGVLSSWALVMTRTRRELSGRSKTNGQ